MRNFLRKMNMNKVLWFGIIVFTIVGLTALILTIYSYKAYINTSLEIDKSIASDFGTFFGGFVGTIFSILSVILLLYSIRIQNDTINAQDFDKRKDEVKSNFFRMLDYHNDNVRQLKVKHIDPKKEADGTNEGRRAFVIFRIQMENLIKLVGEVNDENGYNLTKKEIADITYMFFYYGLDKDWENFIENKIAIYDNHREIAQKTLDKISLNPQKLKLGRTNQTSLSSYFRNMYNAIKLVDDNNVLSRAEKRELIKIYRAQLSNPELYILFMNLLSRFGTQWVQRNYIMEYEFIKNLPEKYCAPYDPKDFFPMQYEYEQI